jgi:hypothetical protein
MIAFVNREPVTKGKTLIIVQKGSEIEWLNVLSRFVLIIMMHQTLQM